MFRQFLPVPFLALLLMGCATPSAPPPPPADDPANPEAVEAPLSPPSNTLEANESADTQPAADTMPATHHSMGGMSGDMKGMKMNQGDQSTPGAQGGQKNGGQQ